MGRTSATLLRPHTDHLGLPESINIMSISHSDTTPGFAGFHLSPSLQRGIAAAGFVEPRPIQTQTIPAALEGRDILGLAQTGTGKTAAFALPILERLLSARKPGPRALIVAPTRELASQISEEIRTLATFTSVKITTIFGGVSARPQSQALRAKPDIIVACPGRLLDLYEQGAVQLSRIEVRVRRLDWILQTHAPELARPDIVSIDVEGWEPEVLRGFSVERYRPQVLSVENVFADIGYRQALRRRGYRLWRHVAPNDVYVPVRSPWRWLRSVVAGHGAPA